MSIEIVGGIVAFALISEAGLIWLLVHYVEKSVEQEIHRYLEAEARKVGEHVAEELGKPLDTDVEFRNRIRPLGVSDDRIT